MRTVSVLLMLVVLVAGIAVNGSRAQPLPGTSVAYQQCLAGAMTPGDRCRALVTALASLDEIGVEYGAVDAADVGGMVGGDTDAIGDDGFWRDIAVRALVGIAVVVVQALVEAYLGGTGRGGTGLNLDTRLDAVLFDPVR